MSKALEAALTWQRGDRLAAERLFREALPDPAAEEGLARLLLELGRPDEALEHIQHDVLLAHTLRAHPRLATYDLLLGLYQRRQVDLQPLNRLALPRLSNLLDDPLGQEILRWTLLDDPRWEREMTRALDEVTDPAKQALLQQQCWNNEYCWVGASPPESRHADPVRKQYEDYPYPRWLTLDRRRPMKAHDTVKGLLNLNRHPKSVLVAGCGTGRHALQAALRYADCAITAVDVSEKSLEYARLKAQELEIRNVEFRREDLREHRGSYDVIECVGVLHHLEDPVLALGHLKGQLPPDGLMKLGLYSRKARRFLEPIRKLGTRDDLRAWRQKVFEHGGPALELTDFYSLSGCRDLGFPAVEHTFDLHQIEAILSEHALDFLAFEIAERLPHELYAKLFPGQGHRLRFWAKVEDLFPDVFRGMYQFWVTPGIATGG